MVVNSAVSWDEPLRANTLCWLIRQSVSLFCFILGFCRILTGFIVRAKIYFEKLHYQAPILRHSRFTSQGSPSDIRPPMYLRYVIAALAASVVENDHNLAMTFYHQGRLCIEEEEIKVWRGKRLHD